MSISPAISELHLQSLVASTRAQLGDGLRSLLLFGSRLASAGQAQRGVPDLLAVVEDGSLAPMLKRSGHGPIVRQLAAVLPPLTLALRSDGGEDLAKLNLIEAAVAKREISRLADLYLAGRLSKRTLLIYARSQECQGELDSLCNRAAERVAALVVRALPPVCTLDEAARACIAISYRAEVRPEGEKKLRALYDGFGQYYEQRFAPLLIAAATERGLQFDAASGVFKDLRQEQTRQADRAELLSYLRRCQLRAVLRWPKQALVYRGWLSYLLDKRRRARAQELQP